MSEPIEYTKVLRKKSDDELAKWQSGWKPHSQQYITAEKEWERRMLMEQLKWQKVAILSALVGTLVGSVLTILSSNLMK